MRGERADDVRMVVRNKHQPDGIITSVDIRPLRDRGAMTGGMVVVRDITRISKSEAHLQRTSDELHHRTQLMETVLDSIADGVIAADQDGGYLVYNRSATQIVGPRIPDLNVEKRPVQYGLYYPGRRDALSVRAASADTRLAPQRVDRRLRPGSAQ